MSEEKNEEKQPTEEFESRSAKRGKFPTDLIFVTLVIYCLFMAVACSQSYSYYYHKEAMTIYTLVFLVWVIILNLFFKGLDFARFYEHLVFYVIFGIIVMIAVPQIPSDNKRRNAWENGCKLTLRAIGSSQLAFKDSYEPNGDFGTWEELTQADFIQEGYNRTNMIDNYSMVVFDVSKRREEQIEDDSYTPSFTIVAIPRSQNNKLRTFAIGDDQKPRIWVGNSDLFDKYKTNLLILDVWDPLR